jgi:hypothetical protein
VGADGLSIERLAQDVVDWLIQYARLQPLDPVPRVQMLAELRREILAALEVAITLERARCARLAQEAGYLALAEQFRAL